MLVYEATELEQDVGRYHPWTTSEKNSDSRYYDFKIHPELIPEVLEDFRPYAHFPAVQRFYDLVAWINGLGSCLESNDCEFQGSHTNIDAQFEKKRRTRGRLMVLFRNLEINCSPENVKWLEDCYALYLPMVLPHFYLGVVGLTKFRTHFTALGKNGQILILSFWSYGDDEYEAMENLDRTFEGIHKASVIVDAQVKKWALCP